MKDRSAAIKAINAAVYDKFLEKEAALLPIKDNDLRRWALDQNRTSENKIEHFQAGKKWLLRFKQKYRIGSRKVCKNSL